MMRRTKARSSNGVMLMSLRVTSELRCEKRRMADWIGLELVQKINHAKHEP